MTNRRKRASTEGTAEVNEGEESSNDESISSVLVEEAHMGEDEGEDPPQEATKDTETGTTGNEEGNAEKPLQETVKGETTDEQVAKADPHPANDEQQQQQKDLEVENEDEKEQFSDWSSEEDGLLVKETDREEKVKECSFGGDELLKHVEDTSDIDNDDLLADDESKGNHSQGKDGNAEKAVSEEASLEEIDDMTTGDERSVAGVNKKRGNLLEEAEAISDDDLEALIEEDTDQLGMMFSLSRMSFLFF